MNISPADMKRIRDAEGYSQEEFAGILQISREMVSKMENGKEPVSAKAILKLQSLYGEDLVKMISHKNITSEPGHVYIRKGSKRPWMGVPMYNMPLTAGFLESFASSEDLLPEYYLHNRNFMDCQFGALVKGESMLNDVRNGDYILCQPVNDHGFIDFGAIYYVITRNGLEVCRYIHPHPKDDKQLLLVAENKSVPHTPIPRKYIAHLFKVRGIIRVF